MKLFKYENIKEVEKFKKIINEKIFKPLLNEKIIAYEVDILDSENNKIQPDGTIELSFDIPSNFSKLNLIAYRVEESRLIPFEFRVEGDKTIINVDHFCTYVLVEQSISNPETGDNLILYLVIGIILAVGVVVTAKKYQRN